MPSFMVEAYMRCSQPGDARAAAERVAAVAEALTRPGAEVRHIRTTCLPDDETCFHLFEAVSADVVEAVSRRAGLGQTRVLRAVADR